MVGWYRWTGVCSCVLASFFFVELHLVMAGTEQFDHRVAPRLRQRGVQRAVDAGCRGQSLRVALRQDQFAATDEQPSVLASLAPRHPRPRVAQQPCALAEVPFDLDPGLHDLRDGDFAGTAIQRDEAAEPVTE